MSNRAWMPLHIDRYLADTGHLTAAEHGAYMLLIMTYWRDGGLPSDERLIARITRLSKDEWEESRDILKSFFKDEWRHSRVDEEMAKADDIIEKRRSAALGKHARGKAPAHAEQVQSKSTDTGVPPRTLEPSSSLRSEDKGPPADADDCEAMVEAYNDAARVAGWSIASATPERRPKLKARLRQAKGLAGWEEAMHRARGSPFLTGDNNRAWLPNIDFFLQPSSFTKLIEGAYDGPNRNRNTAGHAPNRGGSGNALVDAFAAIASGRDDGGFPDSRNPPSPYDDGAVLDLEPVGGAGRHAGGWR